MQETLQLYGTLVRTILEYGSTVWQTAAATDISPLEHVQRKALVMCLNLPSTTWREDMEVVAPLDLRFKEMAIRDLAKIAPKANVEPIKMELTKCTEDPASGTKIHQTPMSKALAQAEDMRTKRGAHILIVQPEPKYQVGHLAMTYSASSYWSTLGSSKSRTAEQEAKGRHLVAEQMNGAPLHTVFAFTE